MKHILVTGSLAFDYIMDFPGIFSDHIMPDKIHKINLSFLLSDLKKQQGGTAGNIAYNLTLLKTKTAIFAAAGNDFSEYLTSLQKADVDTTNIQIIKDKPTASAFIMTDKNDNQITGFYPGAMAHSINYSLKDLGQKPDFVVISPNDPKTIIKLSDECRELTIPFMADIGMQLPSLKSEEIKQIIQNATIIIGNDYEMELLLSKTSLTQQDLLKETTILITTLGQNGSQITTKEETFTIKAAIPKDVVDPTGAGDAYRAGFLAGWIKTLPLQVCGQMGSVAACYAIEKYGTQQHYFTISEFQDRYVQTFEEMLELEK